VVVLGAGRDEVPPPPHAAAYPAYAAPPPVATRPQPPQPSLHAPLPLRPKDQEDQDDAVRVCDAVTSRARASLTDLPECACVAWQALAEVLRASMVSDVLKQAVDVGTLSLTKLDAELSEAETTAAYAHRPRDGARQRD
jgi:hypothetical protein